MSTNRSSGICVYYRTYNIDGLRGAPYKSHDTTGYNARSVHLAVSIKNDDNSSIPEYIPVRFLNPQSPFLGIRLGNEEPQNATIPPS